MCPFANTKSNSPHGTRPIRQIIYSNDSLCDKNENIIFYDLHQKHEFLHELWRCARPVLIALNHPILQIIYCIYSNQCQSCIYEIS